MTPEQLANETEQKDELLFVLHDRDAPTVVFLECNSYTKREELASFLRQNLTEYQFRDIDVTRFSVVSLLRVLTENLSPEVVHSEPVRYVVNVYGLENSLLVTEDGQIKPSLLTAQLNLERESLFRNVPYIIIIWADHLFFQTLQRESPDLWSWVVYRFRFEGPEAVDPEKAPPLPPERLPQRGNIAERLQRIEELQARYNSLNLDTSDKKRLLKDKVSILKLLAEEYVEAFQYDNAQVAYENAIAIAERMHEDNFLCGYLYFNLATVLLNKRQFSAALATYQKIFILAKGHQLGMVYRQIGRVYEEQRQWQQALENYRQALDWQEKTNTIYGLDSIYYQIGQVYEEQRQWGQALENYQQALNWQRKTNNIYEMGIIYHQIGRVYEGQRQWQQALENYHQALDWQEKTGNTYGIGSTYHQIGRVYEEQRQWKWAIENYKQALAWKRKTGNTYKLSSTYHQIGVVYEEQWRLKQALENYQQALDWQEKMGNSYEMGSTYHMIGRVYEEQKNLREALTWYRLAFENLIAHGRNEHLSVVQEALVRVEGQLIIK